MDCFIRQNYYDNIFNKLKKESIKSRCIDTGKKKWILSELPSESNIEYRKKVNWVLCDNPMKTVLLAILYKSVS